MGWSDGIRRVILWDFRRGSWQYDAIVVLILAFIFLTPREWFRDQPRIFDAGDIVMLPAEHGAHVFWLEPELLESVGEPERTPRLSALLHQRTGRAHQVIRVEPIYSAEQELRGYMVVAKP
jgi:hypothetical protein